MSSLPKEFCERIIEQYPDGQELLDGLKTGVITSVHHHARKSGAHGGEAVAWHNQGEILPERPSFTLDPRLHGGAYYPQEASSMFLSHVLKNIQLNDNPICLDMCAAPGGKTLLLQSHLDGKGLVVSNEVISKRNYILQENVAKWGYTNRVVIQAQADSVGRLGPVFDFMQIDAPCSGEGMFRKDPKSRDHWTRSSVATCSERQREIVDNAKWGLKTGGILVYSTCTFAREENEEIVERLCERGAFEPVVIPVDESWNISSPMAGAYQFFPHKTTGEGLFMSVLRKVKAVPEERIKKVNFPKVNLPTEINLPDGIVAIQDRRIHAFPEEFVPFLHHLSQVKIHTAGTALGEFKGRNFIPDHELALALNIPHEYPTVEVDRDKALAYLRKETFSIEGPKGWVAISFENTPLGWAKNLGNRVNNYYPTNWRIRM